MNAYKNASYTGIVLCIIGLIVIFYGLVNLGTEQDLDKNGIKTSGTVFELEVEEPYRRAWVEFTADDGQTVRFLDKLYWNQDFQTYVVGDQVEVIYDPAEPAQTATINEFFQRNTAPWWPFIVGLIVFATGFIMRRIMLKKANQYEEQMKNLVNEDNNHSQ